MSEHAIRGDLVPEGAAPERPGPKGQERTS